MLIGQCCQRVLSEHLARIVQSGHLHGVSTEATHIDAVVEEEVSIEAVVVPHFLVLLTLQVFLEEIDQACILAEIIDEDPGASSEIELRTCEEGGA